MVKQQELKHVDKSEARNFIWEAKLYTLNQLWYIIFNLRLNQEGDNCSLSFLPHSAWQVEI